MSFATLSTHEELTGSLTVPQSESGTFLAEVSDDIINNGKYVTTSEYLPKMIESAVGAEKHCRQVNSAEYDERVTAITHPSANSSESNDDEEWVKTVRPRLSGVGESYNPPPKPPPRYVRTQPEGAKSADEASLQQSRKQTHEQGFEEERYMSKEYEPEVLQLLCTPKPKNFAMRAHNKAAYWFSGEITSKILSNDFDQIATLQQLQNLVDDFMIKANQIYKKESHAVEDQGSNSLYHSYCEAKLKAELDLCRKLLIKKYVSKLEKDSSALKESRERVSESEEMMQKLSTENRVLKELLFDSNKLQQK